jgi:hypothetical protein
MSWLQRYHLRHYVQNSVWLLPVFGIVAGLVSVRCLHWLEARAGWQSGFDPDAARALFGTLAGALFTFITFHLPLGKGFSFNVRGDIGGFGAASDFTWQALPYFGWQFAKWGSLQAGYRWIYADYATGSGASRFKYDMLIQGPQIGFTAHF